MEQEQQKIFRQLGARVKYYRRLRKLSQDKLAHRCGKDGSSVGRLERGEINASIFYLYEISQALEVSVKDLIDF